MLKYPRIELLIDSYRSGTYTKEELIAALTAQVSHENIEALLVTLSASELELLLGYWKELVTRNVDEFITVESVCTTDHQGYATSVNAREERFRTIVLPAVTAWLAKRYRSFRESFSFSTTARDDDDGIADAPLVEEVARKREQELRAAGICERELKEFTEGVHVRVITPGAGGGEAIHLLSGLERRSARWDTDVAGARTALSRQCPSSCD